ncbi:MAG TPA: hypothetical protein VKR62_19290 [Roseiarcus sp.]|nr:hypothetical protein [Roseiarcus sp.]
MRKALDQKREAELRSPIILVFLLLAGCDDAPGEWAAIVYPIEQTGRGSM